MSKGKKGALAAVRASERTKLSVRRRGIVATRRRTGAVRLIRSRRYAFDFSSPLTGIGREKVPPRGRPVKNNRWDSDSEPRVVCQNRASLRGPPRTFAGVYQFVSVLFFPFTVRIPGGTAFPSIVTRTRRLSLCYYLGKKKKKLGALRKGNIERLSGAARIF